ncbi:sialidase family protein [Streptomyces stelliscabiei]|uniref:sialidase family protein n=1 Tax=Streptomyces stelliscabiei TaxID=146820 RepID=UPI0029A12B5B|nr:sialidase family protein [Streptomyces stelliscabiei]MDX2521197.1 sialidase family protein [Streptomyces stelliscabiei]
MSTYRPEEDFLPPPVSLSHEPAAPEPGQAVTLTATLTNTTRITLCGTVLHLSVSGVGQASSIGKLASGTSVTRTWKTRLSDDAEGVVSFVAHALFDVHEDGSDCTRATALLRLPYGSLAAAFDNAGISSDDATTTADIDGSRSSLSAEALASAGLTPGASVTYGGTTFTWPEAQPGDKDNVVSSGQTVRLSGTGTRLAFLGTSTWGAGKGPGKVMYADGTEQDFSVDVPDWYGSYASAAAVLPYRNTPSGRDDNPVSLFTFGVDLEGRELRSVVLPKVGDGLGSSSPALHIFAMTVA